MSIKEGEGSEVSYRAHVIVLPYKGQGHMNPMLQFSKRLASKHIKITVATTVSTINSLASQDGPFNLEPVYDDSNDVDIRSAGGFKTLAERFEKSASVKLVEIVKKNESSENPIKCLVYDANLPWCLEVARGVGICTAGFFTQSCAAIASYLQMREEMMSEEKGKGSVASSGSRPVIGMPRMGSDWGGNGGGERFPLFLRYILGQLSNVSKADWVLFNSFDKLEEEVVKDLSKGLAVKTIGPTLPSIYLDERLKGDTNYGFNIFKPVGDACMNWLNTQESGSVVYVSFGSAASLSVEQMAELAWGLKHRNCKFLWVVRELEKKKLPENFMEETAEKGLVVTWCPQLEVLAHQAIGCFVTHCGWNSTVEGVSLGVPMVAMPQFLDQFSDAKFLEEVWQVGLRPKVDAEKGIVKREEIERCIREVMVGEKSEEIKKNANKWKELAKEAVDEGGSSERNIEEIVAKLVCT